MHKKSMIIFAIVAVMLVSIVPVFAAKPTNPASTNEVEKGKNDHLYLYAKDPETWEIVKEGAWGKMNININKGRFVLNAHKLEPETDYALICYQDPWPGTGSMLLGNGTSDDQGNIHIKGSIDYEVLPSYVYDMNGEQVEGSKIWLVSAADFDESSTEMAAWNPSKYLFEFDLINKQVVTE